MVDQQNVPGRLPIGYWLKHTDEVITEHVNTVLSEHGFTRFRWQVLNSIYEAGITSWKDVFNTMQTFIDERQLDEIIDGFVREGWLVKRGDGGAVELALTDAGKAERETIFRRQSDVRRRVLQGITDQEYSTVIDVLQRMVRNLE